MKYQLFIAVIMTLTAATTISSGEQGCCAGLPAAPAPAA